MGRIKTFIHDLLEEQYAPSLRARVFRAGLIALITLNVLAYMLETVHEISAPHRHWFLAFERFSVCVFTVEYVLRVWVCDQCLVDDHPVLCRVRFMFRPLMLVDLLAILPFYLPLLIPMDLIFLRTLRLLRLARVLKLGRYSDAMQVFGAVVRNKKEQLAVVCFILCILLVVASSLVYHFEHEAQPAVFGSIPESLWWAVITLTTVGYGDVYPVTAMGRIMASLIALLGIGMFALPAGILSAGFVEWRERQEKPKVCPHCGKRIE
ncbi:ion transporter [Salidesulfovibrio onnuriiensis]|uniref:ion transporter n=1 Tax=Salidesulfovibrio onnuriiensis TaxID=2583823 RepID=UPI0011CAA71E|nr:ion transporter [Salidesulfovibrio onnuriiensis]